MASIADVFLRTSYVKEARSREYVPYLFVFVHVSAGDISVGAVVR
jgi:hypothetical protein